MAKLLKFGVGYTPEKSSVNKQTGEKTTMSCANLLIFMDGKSGFAVYPQLQSFLRNNVEISDKGDTISITVPEDKFAIFANPNGKLMGRILSTIEQVTGYVADSNDIAALPDRFQIAKDEVLNADKDALDSDMNKYIEELIAGIEKDFNDPRFQQILSAMHVFGGSGGFSSVASNVSYNDDDVVLKETKLSVENVLRILAQWHKAGRQGIPTYLATEVQWHKFFGGRVSQNALKLYIVRPDKVSSVSPKTVTKQLGINPNSADSGGAIGRGIHSIARGGGMDKWRGNQNGYALACYYDITDVDGVDPNLLTGNTANYYDPNTVTADTTMADTAGDTPAQDTGQNDLVTDNGKMTEVSLNKRLLKYAADNKIDGIPLAIQRDGTLGGLMFMIGHLKSIFRNRDANEKKATTEQILFVILKHYGIFENEVHQLYKKFISELRTPQGKVNKKLLYGIWSFAYDIISELDAINESRGGELTFMDVITYLGFTPEEYKRMPETEEEANELMNGVKESFIKTFNKLLV